MLIKSPRFNSPLSKIVFNPHFGIILFLTFVIILIYYSRIFMDYRPFWSWKIEVFEYTNGSYGSIFIFTLIYTAIIFWWRGLLVYWLISIAIIIPLFVYYNTSPIYIITTIFYLSIPLIIVFNIHLLVTWRNKEKKLWIEMEQERRLYVAEILKAHENERKIIAQELHDDSIQSLMVTITSLGIIIKNAPKNDSMEIISDASSIREEIMCVIKTLKKLSLDLRPAILDNIGLTEAIRWLVQRFSQDKNIKIEFSIRGEERDLAHETNVILFRVVQEALNNIQYHSKATEVTISIEYLLNMVKLRISDNGQGFNVPKRINSLIFKNHLGLIGMQERVNSLNGSFNVQSAPGQGTIISVDLFTTDLPEY